MPFIFLFKNISPEKKRKQNKNISKKKKDLQKKDQKKKRRNSNEKTKYFLK